MPSAGLLRHSTHCGFVSQPRRSSPSAPCTFRVSDDSFEQSVEEAPEAGRSKASGSIFLGVDANCNIDDSDDQIGALVKEMCAVHDTHPLFQRCWTLVWQLPAGGTRKKKKKDFFFTNQTTATVSIAENLHSRSDHKPLRLTRPHVPGVMLEFERRKKSFAGWAPQTLPQHHDLQIALSKHVSLGSTVGQIQQILEMIMNDVNRDGELQARELMSDVN